MRPGSAPRNEPWLLGSPKTTESELLSICCVCDDSIGANRIKERFARGDDFSEATVAVRDLMETGMDEWPSAIVIDTSHTSASVNLESAFSRLAPRDSSTVWDWPVRSSSAGGTKVLRAGGPSSLAQRWSFGFQ